MKITGIKPIIVVTLLTLDAAVICFAFYFSYHMRFFSIVTDVFPLERGIPEWIFYKYLLYLIVPLYLFVFSQHSFYSVYFTPFLDELLRVARAGSESFFFLVMATFFYRDFSFSRLTFLFFWINSILFIFIAREIFKTTTTYFLYRILGKERILVIGKENKVLKKIIKQHPYIKVTYYPYDDLPNAEKIKSIILDKSINQVILTHQKWPQDKLLNFYDMCENLKTDLKFVPDIVQICRGEIIIDSSLGIPVFHLKSVSLDGFNFYFKRVVDLILSIIFISFSWPVLLFIIYLIKVDSSGSFLYYHKRVGYRGKIFSFYKFRTMVKNADALLEEVKSQNERQGPVFKMSKDPRITRVGRFLRRYSLDEIPQIINVLRGEMSIVGPRPQVLWEAEAYDDWSRRRLRVLPGITGIWQVSGRASLSYEEMIELDIFYIENWSMGLDLNIIFRTIPAVITKEGAY
ncbi:MAG: sugar transferase [Elusimicrobia bacterium]|nr:sugar transferase [Candidatus Liberimonas magnetica]